MVKDLNQSIINYLKVNHGFNSSAKISQELHVSRKTIIRRIDQLNKNFPEKIIVSKRSQGFELVYQNYLKYEHRNSTTLSQINERQENILTRLLIASPKAVSITDIINSLYVSEAVIQNDEKMITAKIKKWNLSLVRKQRFLSIKGTEKNIRNAIIEVVLHVNNTTEISSLRNSIGKYDDKDFDFALEQLKFAVKSLNNNLPYPYNINFFTHIYILLNRARTYKSVNYSVESKSSIKRKSRENPEIFKICQKIIQNIESYLNVQPLSLEVETYYLFEYLISSRLSDKKCEITSDDHKLAEQVSEKYITLVSQFLKTNFSKYILNDIKNHIFSMIIRLKMQVSLPNALLNDIKLEYKPVFVATKLASEQVSHKFNLPTISDNETGFICLYFVKYLEAQPERNKRVHVYIICTTGIGTSEIISAKIRKLMPQLKVIGLGSSFEIEDILKKYKNIDLIISTVPITIKTNVPVELVSAFLTKEDEKNVRQAVLRIQKQQ